MPTEVSPAEDSARSVETPAAKNGLENQPDTRQGIPAPIVPILWQIVLAGVVIIGALLMLLLRRAAISRWRTK